MLVDVEERREGADNGIDEGDEACALAEDDTIASQQIAMVNGGNENHFDAHTDISKITCSTRIESELSLIPPNNAAKTQGQSIFFLVFFCSLFIGFTYPRLCSRVVLITIINRLVSTKENHTKGSLSCITQCLLDV